MDAEQDGVGGEFLDAALSYVRRGWMVFPLHGIDSEGLCTCGKELCPDAGKHPITLNGLKSSTLDEAQVLKWWDRAGVPWNIGLRTGECSDLTVLDIDIGPGKGGAETWQQLIAEAGEPETLVARTGSGGAHYFFRYNSALNTSSNTLGKGVDCRNDKGYVVAAPSRHRSGGTYAWENWGETVAALPKHLSKRPETRGRKRKDDPRNRRYDVEDCRRMLKFIDAGDRDLWRNVGVILGRTYRGQAGSLEEAWGVYVEWSDSWAGKKGRNHDEIMRQAFYEEGAKDGELSIGTLVHHALEGGWAPDTGKMTAENFFYYSPGANYIYRPTSEHWPAESVDALVARINVNGALVKASEWLKLNRYATSITSDPALEEHTPELDIRNGIIMEGEKGSATYNSYMAPRIPLGDARLAGPFLDHVRAVFNKEGDADQFLDYMAHRVQCPGEKPRFALLIAGEQGVGKDTAISMCMPAVGEWNCCTIKPADIESPYNDYAKFVLINIAETANNGDMTKWAFNEQTKTLIAGNPDVMKVNPKYGKQFSVRLHAGVVMTTNHMMSGIYIPPDDRRYDVIECATKTELDLENPFVRGEYFQKLWNWFKNEEGDQHIAAFLNERDISHFSASTGQRITEAHSRVTKTGLEGDEWCMDALLMLAEPSSLGLVPPPWTTARHLVEALKKTNFADMKIEAVRKLMNHAMERHGYYKLHCVETKDGRWNMREEDGTRVLVGVYFDPKRIEAVAVINSLKAAKLPPKTF